jgi:hypothetical protein
VAAWILAAEVVVAAAAAAQRERALRRAEVDAQPAAS